MFSKIKTTIRKIFKSPQLWVGLSLLLVLVILPETTLAANPSNAATGPTGANVINEVFAKLAAMFQIFMNFLAMMLWPVLLLIGGLLQNDILFGGGMEERMRLIWVEVRNIVNFTFVLALVGLAFYNALGVAEDKIKSVLPKIIIGIIAVNFTFLAAKVVLDVANVVTVAVFALPQSIDPNLASIQPSGDAALKDFQSAVCRSIYPPDGITSGYIDGILREKGRQYLIKPSDAKTDKCLSSASNASIKALANVAPASTAKTKSGTAPAPTPAQITANQNLYATDAGLRKCVEESFICGGVSPLSFNFSNVAAINNKGLTAGQTKKDAGFFKSNLQKLFGTYSVNNAALAMALNLQKVYDIRNVKIPGEFSRFTLNIIFSLVLFIIYSSAYIALFAILIVRVLVLWIAVSLSPLIIFSKYGISVPEVSDKIDNLVDAFIKHTIAPIVIGGTMTLGFIMLKSFQGVDHTQMNLVSGSVLTFETALFNIPSSGMNTFKELLIAIATCGVIWLGVFKTAEGTWAAGFTNLLGSTLQGIGKFILQSPQYLPLIPMGIDKQTGKEKRIGLSSALQGFRDLPAQFRGKAASDANALSQGLYNRLTGTGGFFNPAGKKYGDATNKQEAMAIVQHNAQTGVNNPKELLAALENGSLKTVRAELQKKQPDFYKKFSTALKSGRTLAASDPLWQQFLKHTDAIKYTAASPSGAPGNTPPVQRDTAQAKNYISSLQGLQGDQLNRAKTGLSTSDQKQLADYQSVLKGNDAAAKQKLEQELATAGSAAQALMQRVQAITGGMGTQYQTAIQTPANRDTAIQGYATSMAGKIGRSQIYDIFDKDLTTLIPDQTARNTYINQQLDAANVR